jgi:hypothetical protein
MLFPSLNPAYFAFPVSGIYSVRLTIQTSGFPILELARFLALIGPAYLALRS